MSTAEFILFVFILAADDLILRGLPFVVFRNRSKTPGFIEYLGKVLPAAMMGLLVVYCFKDLDYGEMSEILPAAAASLSVVLVHLWKRNTIISIALGTAVYMILIRVC